MGRAFESKNLNFTKDDFFNEYEKNHFFEHLNKVPEQDTYMKKAVIHRVMMETNAEDTTHYEKLMGYIQSKGIDYILNVLEKKETQPQIVNEKQIEEIVYRILAKQNVSFVSVQNEERTVLTTAKTQEKPLEERKKASSKLKNL